MGSKPKRRDQPRQKAVPVVVPPSTDVRTEDEPEQLPSSAAGPPPPEEALSLISNLQAMRGSRVMTFVAAPEVTVRGDVVEQVYEQLRQIGPTPTIDLFLHSAGGQIEVPWRLISLVRDFCERFNVLIPGMAYSAATQLAMGADEIVMGPFSELSPVDPQRSHPLLPPAREGERPIVASVQDMRQCIEFIKSECGDSWPQSSASIFTALFDKIHPLAIGAIQASYALARLISRKALSTHMDAERDKDKIDQLVEAFSKGFFSHDYRIGWREATELGLNVARADGQLWETMWALYRHYRAYFTLVKTPDKEGLLARPIVWIDTMHQRHILEELLRQQPRSGAPSVPLKHVESRWLVRRWQ